MARLAMLALVALITVVSIDASPIRTCPSTCFCRHITSTVKKADCRDIPEWDLKGSDAQVVRIIPPMHPVTSSPLSLSRLDMFPKVQMLSVTNRSIVEVLSDGNSPTLQVLDLSHNKLTRFNERTFRHMPALRQLNLAGNPLSLRKNLPILTSSSIRTLLLGYTGITHIPNGSLSGTPNLISLYLQGNPLKLQEGVPLVDRSSIQELDLSYCKLTKIPHQTLDNLVNLQRLYLKGNDLKTVFPNVLPINVHHLDLSANRIRDVPIPTLSDLKNLTDLELAKNPVKCTCDLISFLDRLSEHNVIFEKMIVCAEPEKYAKVPWKDVDERELCKDDITSESGDSSEDRSTSASFEKDDVSYETDGPEEENRILSQHPSPLSLQTLLQNSSRYQNMEENSIQSDQPYSNTSDEIDHMNDAPGTTETVLDDDLIVADPEGTTEFYEISKEDPDSLVLPAVPDDTGKISTKEPVEKSEETISGANDLDDTSTESKSSRESSVETNEDTLPVANDLKNATPTLRDREKLEDEKEQKEDLLKAPNASLEINERPESPISEESTENPDSETFMKNEETIAMGKMMPESKDSDRTSESNGKVDVHEKAEPPVILASQSEGQVEETDGSEDTWHHESTPEVSEELLYPQSDEDRDSLESASEATKAEKEAATNMPIHLSSGASAESTPLISEGNLVSDSSFETPETNTRDRTNPTEEYTTDAGAVLKTTKGVLEEASEDRTSKSLASAENGLGRSQQEHSEDNHKVPYSNSETGHGEPTASATSEERSEHSNENMSIENHPGIDKTETERSGYDLVGENELHKPTEIAHTPSPTPDPVSTDKGVSPNSYLFDDIDAQMASIFPDTPSTTERQQRLVQTTLALETTEQTETTTQKESSRSFGFFPFSLVPNDDKPRAVSEPDGFPSQTSETEDLSVENNLARVSDSDVVSEEGDVQTATMACAIIAGVLVCIIIAVACVSLRTRSNKKGNSSAPVRMRGDSASPGTEMKDMMNPLLEPVVEGQTANEFHDDPTRQTNGQISSVKEMNGIHINGAPVSEGDVTEVVIEGNGVAAAVNGKPPRQNGVNRVKIVAGVIPVAVPRTPVYVKKVIGES